MGEKFKNRKEKRQVTETMYDLLQPMVKYLNNETVIKVKKALYLLGTIEIEEGE